MEDTHGAGMEDTHYLPGWSRNGGHPLFAGMEDTHYLPGLIWVRWGFGRVRRISNSPNAE